MRENTEPVTLSGGGVPGDTEIFTDSGPAPIEQLDASTLVYALNPTTGLAKLKPVRGVTEFDYDGRLVDLDARRVDFRLHPEHRFPYRTRSFDTVRYQRAGELPNREKYLFINEWRTPKYSERNTIDITEFLDDYQVCVDYDCHGNAFRAALPDRCEPVGLSQWSGYLFDAETFSQFQEQIESAATDVAIREGKTHGLRPYRFDTEDFVRFIGWFVSEGTVTRKEESDGASIWISQYDSDHRNRIAALLERMNIDASASKNGYYFGSALFGRFLENECGRTARDKQLPDFVWTLPATQKQLLLRVLMDGDGDNSGRFSTASLNLRNDVLRLCLEIGIKPRYYRRSDCWTVFTRPVNDRLSSSTHVSESAYDGPLYRLAVEDYCVVMAGRNGKFQWIGVSEMV